ncbi:hypothetical protein ACJZ2D_008674 [Fusarium nematophilum]
MLALSSHEFYNGQESLARDYYARWAEDTAVVLASEGVPRPELIQSLCLIALKHIRSQKFGRAWMAIGTASRLDCVRTLRRSSAPNHDSVAKGYWSVFLLERLFVPYTLGLPACDSPDYPGSAPLPPAPSSFNLRREPTHLQATGPTPTPNRDGKTRSYLHRLRKGETKKSWLAESTHTKLSIELVEFETQLSGRHLLINVAPTNRTAAEVSEQREHWNPWMTMQIVSHATYAVLNHPFLHLVVLRSQESIPQSCFFLQQRVDRVLYHAGWVFRLVQTSQDASMEVVDPLIGDAVAATATVSWLFQFSRDSEVPRRARGDLSRCEPLSGTYPCATSLTCTNSSPFFKSCETNESDTTISFKPAWIWELLDPRIHQAGSGDTVALCESGSDPNAKMCLKTHFVQPLQEDENRGQEHQVEPVENTMNSLFMSPEDFEEFDIEALSRDFLQNGFWDQGY